MCGWAATSGSTRLWQGRGDLVFAHPQTGGPLPKANVTRRMRAALKAAKRDTAPRFHDLRHTFGARMAAAGVPMRTLQEWMGHRDLATTQIYADYAPSAQEAEMARRGFRRLEAAFEVSGPGQGSRTRHG
jgi:integrase